ncbi:MAG: hypothetical protein Q7U54_18570 [Bacteroidales bacterium]|nr:hypothetical protein [Bacteroidales bacterium]
MISILTGDIINSRKSKPGIWLEALKSELNLVGQSPEYWETYGGDTFQLRVDDPLNALLVAIKIKAAIKTIEHLDVRLSIGIGDITYKSERITECNGSAFIFSGEKFNLLKKEKQTLAVKTTWPDFDTTINLCLRLGTVFMDKWSFKSAEIVNLRLTRPQASQEELGLIHGNLKQNAVSSRLTRAHFDEIMEINELYKSKLNELL